MVLHFQEREQSHVGSVSEAFAKDATLRPICEQGRVVKREARTRSYCGIRGYWISCISQEIDRYA